MRFLLWLDSAQRDRLFQPILNALAGRVTKTQVVSFCMMGVALSTLLNAYADWLLHRLSGGTIAFDLAIILSGSYVYITAPRRGDDLPDFVLRMSLTGFILYYSELILAHRWTDYMITIPPNTHPSRTGVTLSGASLIANTVCYWAGLYFAACKVPPPRRRRQEVWGKGKLATVRG